VALYSLEFLADLRSEASLAAEERLAIGVAAGDEAGHSAFLAGILQTEVAIDRVTELPPLA
jgi:hypothetical protein